MGESKENGFFKMKSINSEDAMKIVNCDSRGF